MDRSEPALVPEWLRSAGSVGGAGNSAQHFASSSNHTGNFGVLFELLMYFNALAGFKL